MNTGGWSNQFLVPYKLAKDSQTINHANAIILRGNQSAMPKTLWKLSLKLAHEVHQELAKTKPRSEKRLGSVHGKISNRRD